MRILNFSEIYSMIMVIGVDKGVEQEMEETKQIYLLVVSGKFIFWFHFLRYKSDRRKRREKICPYAFWRG